jgi:hypothetical protein
MRLKKIEISGKKYFVSVAKGTVSLLRIFSYDLKLIYEKTFLSDYNVVDFDLMYDGTILILIIEDCILKTRELKILDFKSNSYITSPAFDV